MLSACKKDEGQSTPVFTLSGVTSLTEGKAAYNISRVNWIVKHVWELKGSNWALGFGYDAGRDTINGKFRFYPDDAIGGINADADGLGYFLSKGHNLHFTVPVDSEGNIFGEWSDTHKQHEYNRLNRPEITRKFDTVAYIPNAVMERTRNEVRAALKAGDMNRCYELFDKAIVFIPITGEEYKELEARGEN